MRIWLPILVAAGLLAGGAARIMSAPRPAPVSAVRLATAIRVSGVPCSSHARPAASRSHAVVLAATSGVGVSDPAAMMDGHM